MIVDLIPIVTDYASLAAAADTSSTQSGPPWWILAAGPVGGAGTYWAIYKYYRNQDKSHHFERDTLISEKPVEGTEKVIDQIRKTSDPDIDGGNGSSHRERVKRVT
ncbi:hypothetical protein [Demetria terragena]|uniref:hypothetical protein n=1 Tax=Demetria terragena TaxID=63959 RepID=UPI00035DAB93|nr:hypothetical protein [Demetria terragena]